MTPLAWMVLVGVGSPAALLALLGTASLVIPAAPPFRRPFTALREQWTGRIAGAFIATSFVALALALPVNGSAIRLLSYGDWSASREGGIAIEFLVDRLSLAFAALSAAICGVVSAFSNRYLHRERGYNRYFVLLAMFLTGMLLVALAGNVAVLFVGWELVGLSSALLVGFFHERPAPVSNALRVLSVYRISDAAMLSAAVMLRSIAGTDSLALLFSGGIGAVSSVGLTQTSATIIALLLIVAVAGKSALLPFSSWLPRAMEGPTPSSAVYYGSLSIHAGCFLLLRSAPLLEHTTGARIFAAALGLATAVFAAITTRVQSDVKSSLAFAALTQVGIIVLEISAGWYTLAFVHMVGHACFRLLQFLSAPNVLHDLHGMEDAIGDRPTAANWTERLLPDGIRRRVFLVALERGFLDSTLDRVIVGPFTGIARRLSNVDRRLCDAVIGDVDRLGPQSPRAGDD